MSAQATPTPEEQAGRMRAHGTGSWALPHIRSSEGIPGLWAVRVPAAETFEDRGDWSGNGKAKVHCILPVRILGSISTKRLSFFAPAVCALEEVV
jgi:hypothetical protein